MYKIPKAYILRPNIGLTSSTAWYTIKDLICLMDPKGEFIEVAGVLAIWNLALQFILLI